jgi:hypothetical protein
MSYARFRPEGLLSPMRSTVKSNGICAYGVRGSIPVNVPAFPELSLVAVAFASLRCPSFLPLGPCSADRHGTGPLTCNSSCEHDMAEKFGQLLDKNYFRENSFASSNPE